MLTTNISNSVPRRSEKKTCSHKDLYVSAHSNFIHSNQKLKSTQKPINRWLDEKWTFCGISVYWDTTLQWKRKKKNEWIHNNTNEYTVKKEGRNKSTYSMTPHIWHYRRCKTDLVWTKLIGGCLGPWVKFLGDESEIFWLWWWPYECLHLWKLIVLKT